MFNYNFNFGILKSSKLICPYCLADLSYVNDEKLLKCKICNQDIPPVYKRDYSNTPPIFVQLLGWRQVGKTTFLRALTYCLLKLNLI